MWFAVRGRWRQMILLFLIVRRTPTIRELIVATPLSLSSPSVTGLSAHAPAQRLERSDFVLRPVAHLPDRTGYGRNASKTGRSLGSTAQLAAITRTRAVLAGRGGGERAVNWRARVAQKPDWQTRSTREIVRGVRAVRERLL